MRMLLITSRENAHVKEYCKLKSSKKQRDIQSSFVVEGLKLTLEAYNNGVSIEKVFLTDHALQKYQEKLFELLNSGITALQITDEVAKKMSDTESPQGIFAQCSKLDKFLSPDTIEDNGIYLALSDLQDPGNIGTIIRTAEAIGVKGLLLSESCCDIYNPKVVRASMGSVFRVPFWVSSDFCWDLRTFSDKGIISYATVPDSEAKSITQVEFGGSGIAVIGNEGNGLSPEVISCCDEKITIKMRGNTESLNAAMAAGIIMWQMQF